MLNYLWEQLRWPDGRVVSLHSQVQTESGIEFDSARYLTSFRLEMGLPVWTYDVEGVRFEKRVLMPHLQNTTHVSYRLLSDTPASDGNIPVSTGRHSTRSPGSVRAHTPRCDRCREPR